MTVPGKLEQQAVQLAADGYHVFPCRPGDKRPATANGFKDATRDERQILQWWDRDSTYNIGIACGASGITVLDIDSKSGANPTDILADRELHKAPIVLTGVAPDQDAQHPASLPGVRGVQVYFKGSLPTGPLPIVGCEIRGQGAYVVAPGSLHPSGATYTGQLPHAGQLPDVPQWLIDLAAASRSNGHRPAAEVAGEITAGLRNQALASMAGTMRRRGMDADEIAAALHVTNRKRCRPPLDDAEVDQIAASIARYEPAQAADGAHMPQVAPDRAAAAAALTELLELGTVGVRVTGARVYGRGSAASADVRLSDGTVIVFESLRDFGTPSRLMVEVAACTGATPKLKGAQAMQALALLRQVAEHSASVTPDDLTRDWCHGYLQGASVLDVDMTDQAQRWGAFCHLRDHDDEGSLGVVLRHLDGTRYVRTGWFRNYVRSVHDHTASPQQITGRVARLGWSRPGVRGAVKATQPSGQGMLMWTFYTVPAGWEDTNS